MTCNGIRIETPQSIMDEDNVDVFEAIIPNTDYQYQKKRSELWAKYRYRGLGSCDRAYWVQCMQDRYALIKDTWDVKIHAWVQYETSVTSTIDFSQSSASSTTTINSEREDTPDNPAGTTVYLSDRSKTVNSYTGQTHEGLESETVDDYIKAVPDPWDGFTSQFSRLFSYVM